MSTGRTPPNIIEVMLHCYYSPEPYPRDTPAVRRALQLLVHHDLIQAENKTEDGWIYKATEKGKEWVEMICSTPFPIAVTLWRDPRAENV